MIEALAGLVAMCFIFYVMFGMKRHRDYGGTPKEDEGM